MKSFSKINSRKFRLNLKKLKMPNSKKKQGQEMYLLKNKK